MSEDNNRAKTPEILLPDDFVVPEGLKEKPAEKADSPAGRKPIEEDLELQLEYFKIWTWVAVGNIPKVQVAKAMGVSLGKVKLAERWVTKNYARYGADEAVAHHKFLIQQRKREVEKLIGASEAGEPILYPDGTPVLDSDGKAMMKVDKHFLRQLRRDRWEMDCKEMELDCLGRGIAQIFNSQIINQSNITVNNKADEVLAIGYQMGDEDRQELIKIMGKYGKPPE